MPGIFLECLHISGIFARIQVFFRVIKQNLFKILDFPGTLPSGPPNSCRPLAAHFATVGIFRRFQVFFRGNYFFQVLAPLSVFVRSPLPGGYSPPPVTCPLGLCLLYNVHLAMVTSKIFLEQTFVSV